MTRAVLAAALSLPLAGLVAAYDFSAPNLTPLSEGPLASMVRGGAPAITEVAGSNGYAAWLVFPAGVPTGAQYAYSTALGILPSTAYTIGVVVKMDGGGAPVLGSSSDPAADFSLVLANNAITASAANSGVENLGGGLYRVWIRATTSSSAPGNYFGVVRYTAQSGRGFRVTAFHLRADAAATYERTTDLQTLPTFRSDPTRAGTLGSAATADSNDPTWGPYGLNFDGVDDYVSLNAPAGASGETLMFRVPGPALSGRANDVATVYSQGTQSGGAAPYLWVYTSGGVLTIQLADGVTRITASSPAVNVGDLCAVTVDYAAGEVRWYRAGERTRTVQNPRAFLPVAASVARLGMYAASIAHTGSGIQSWFSRHDRALSDAEVMRAYRFIRNHLSRRGVTV
ncbi:hypothetical protein [Deinococcus sp. JMULE3]|uniref:phage head spike fiber domain-containing protein n=1 Tax=Deinococcus sp. JMULE3 TaxID=2518341 RepID=UPI00157615B2|nr:hypothetical protein [Deinococcus sp. JMULE3]NTX99296.1 hypothetical protein [Deinococcus sp. JMULE3]